jgi:hypothetical protein
MEYLAGDFLPCSGNSRLSNAIKTVQGFAGYDKEERQISHIAGIVKVSEKMAELLRLDFTGLGVFESTTFNAWAGENGKKGVQINPFDQWLKNYDGKVYVRKLDFMRTPEYYAKDNEFVLASVGLPYESGIPGAAELLLCALGMNRFVEKIWPSYRPIETAKIHCSENEAKRDQMHGLFNKVMIPNRMPPAFWWSEIDKYLTCPIGKPERLK